MLLIMAHQYTVNAVMLEGSVISIINDVAAIDRTLTCAAVLLVTGKVVLKQWEPSKKIFQKL